MSFDSHTVGYRRKGSTTFTEERYVGATGTVPGSQETPPVVEMIALLKHLLNAYTSRELGGPDFFITWNCVWGFFIAGKTNRLPMAEMCSPSVFAGQKSDTGGIGLKSRCRQSRLPSLWGL